MRATWTLALALSVACLGGCGGGGGGGDGGSTGPVLLFADDFSSGTILPNWMPSDFTYVQIDGTIGAPDAPCLLIQDTGGSSAYATADVAAWPAAGGLDIWVRVCLPPDDLCQGTAILYPSPVVEIIRVASGTRIAAFQFIRASGAPGTRCLTQLVYWVNNTLNDSAEVLPAGYFTGQFIDIGFHISPDGDVRWTRDGVTKMEMLAGNPYWPFEMNQSYTLRLRGGQTNAGGDLFDVRFDDVEVLK